VLLASCGLAPPACYTGLDVDARNVGGTGAGTTTDHDEGETGDTTGADDDGGEPLCPDAPGGPSDLRRLTRSSHANTLRDLLHLDAGAVADATNTFEDDEVHGGFHRNDTVPVTDDAVEDYMRIAEQLAEQAVSDLDALAPCTDDDDICAQAFIAEFGRRAWRRPLMADEQDLLRELYGTGDGHGDGIRLVISALLQSPYFLYHIEVGPGDLSEAGRTKLGAYEVASKLSYFLWNTMPDDQLLDAAEDGTLDDVEGLLTTAERMLDDPRAFDAIGSFHRQWLGIESLPYLQKDADLHPEFDDALADSMIRETELFADYVVRRGDGRLETLLTAQFSFVDDALSQLYGVDLTTDVIDLPMADSSSGFVPVELDPAERAGVLTHAGVMAALAKPNNTNIPLRGRFLAERLACVEIPDPPPVDVDLPEPDADATARERLIEVTSVPPCVGCHGIINPMGFMLETYDAVGRHRLTDHFAHAIDASGSFPTTDVAGEYESFVSAVPDLAQSADVAECMARQWYRYVNGPESDEDACQVDALVAEFRATDNNVRDLLLAIVRSDAFRYRRATQ
jgi:hypothetical protein